MMKLMQLKKGMFSPHLQMKATYFVAGLGIILNIICICNLTALVYHSESQNGQTNPLKNSPTEDYLACVPLDESLSDAILRKLSLVEKDNKTLGCAKTPEQVSALLQELLSRPKKKEEPLPTFDPNNFALSKYSAQKPLLQSRIRDSRVEHARGIDVNATETVIKDSGYYYVYSNIMFKPDSALPCEDDEARSWHHDIVLTRDSDKLASGVILLSTHTCCDNCLNEIASSFAGGVVYLQQMDKIHVEVPGHGLGGYFGLYILGGSEQG